MRLVHAQTFNDGTARPDWRRPTEPDTIRWFLLFGSCMVHASTMMRRGVLEQVGFYRSHPSEDYDLWIRTSTMTKMANLPDVLVRVRVLPNSPTKRRLVLPGQRSTDLQPKGSTRSERQSRYCF